MTYITLQDLLDELGEKKLIELTNESRTATTVNETRVQKAILYAQGTVDAYARPRYTLPLPATEKVKSLNLDLAVFHLYRGRATSADGIYEIKRHAHEDAIKFLQAINKGSAALDVPAAEETATNPGSPDRVLSGNTKPVFTDENLKGY